MFFQKNFVLNNFLLFAKELRAIDARHTAYAHLIPIYGVVYRILKSVTGSIT